jgi:hypothetical protein
MMADVFVLAVLDGFVRGKILGQIVVVLGFIGMDMALAMNVLANDGQNVRDPLLSANK